MDATWVLVIPPLLLAVIVHEVSHGWIAYKLGDPTAKMLGRLTLNPIKHIDPIGTVIFPLLQLLAAGRVFLAWAKPVPVNIRSFKKPIEHYAIVAAAGPISNLLQAIVWAAPLWFMTDTQLSGVSEAFVKMAVLGIQVNLALMAFNLIPIPPLDGSRIVAALLPGHLSIKYLQMERFSFMILILLLVVYPRAIHGVIVPVINFFMRILLPGY